MDPKLQVQCWYLSFRHLVLWWTWFRQLPLCVAQITEGDANGDTIVILYCGGHGSDGLTVATAGSPVNRWRYWQWGHNHHDLWVELATLQDVLKARVFGRTCCIEWNDVKRPSQLDLLSLFEYFNNRYMHILAYCLLWGKITRYNIFFTVYLCQRKVDTRNKIQITSNVWSSETGKPKEANSMPSTKMFFFLYSQVYTSDFTYGTW